MTDAGDTNSPRAVVARFLAANSVLDVDAMFDEIGEDARWVFPAAPPGAPREVAGKATNRGFFESILPMWTAFELTFTDVSALEGSSNRAVAYYASKGTLVDGSPYANTYLSLVTVEHGKIVEWIEFCDAEPLVRGIGALQAGAAADAA